MKLSSIKPTKISVKTPVVDESSGNGQLAPSRIDPEGLDPAYGNPEYSKAADQLIGVIRDRIVRAKSEPYSKDKVLTIANKILESRMR